jgi:outer membrane protein assembly factor BamB
MRPAGEQPGGGALSLRLALACFALFALLTLYQLVFRPKFVGQANLLQELQEAVFLDDAGVSPVAGAWPQWRGPRRDGVSTETGLLTPWPEGGPPVKWRHGIGTGYSSVVADGGQVYLLCQDVEDGNKEAVVCWDADSGTELWKYSYPARFINSQGGDGPRSTPCLDEGRLYTVGGTGLMHCLDTTNKGKVLWQHDLLKDAGANKPTWGVSFSPLVVDDLVLTNPGGPNGQSVVAYHKKTGERAWGALGDPAAYSSPVLVQAGDTRQVVFFTAAGLAGLAPADGRVLWTFPWKTPNDVNAATPLPLRARRGDDPLTYVFVSSAYGRGSALVKVTADGGGAYHAEQVFESRWFRNRFPTSVRLGEYVYGTDDTRTLACLSLKTGQVMWGQDGFPQASLTAVDGHLLVLSEDGKLTLVEATPEGYHEKASCQPLRGRCWAMPVLADGWLFVHNDQELLCLDLAKR